MRALFALVFVAACATVYASSPGARVAGCWIDRSEHAVTTMRWFGDEMRPGALRGDWLLYPEDAETPQAALYRLEPRAENWALCQVEAAGERCWQVAEASEGSLAGGRAFIDTHNETLRITVIGDGADRVIFNGARDGCD